MSCWLCEKENFQTKKSQGKKKLKFKLGYSGFRTPPSQKKPKNELVNEVVSAELDNVKNQIVEMTEIVKGLEV